MIGAVEFDIEPATTAAPVNATFDDLNPDTHDRWAYPDTGASDPERNLAEFLPMVPEYRRRGDLGFTFNLQGGSPERYCDIQPWINTAFTAYGELRPAYMDRLGRVLDRLDALGRWVARVKAMANYRPMPITFNEDDNTGFDRPSNDLIAAVEQHASWGFYDPGEGARGYHVRSTYTDGFQNVPFNWTINTDRKRDFFNLTREITGGLEP